MHTIIFQRIKGKKLIEKHFVKFEIELKSRTGIFFVFRVVKLFFSRRNKITFLALTFQRTRRAPRANGFIEKISVRFFLTSINKLEDIESEKNLEVKSNHFYFLLGNVHKRRQA